jgi:hypothetical protein
MTRNIKIIIYVFLLAVLLGCSNSKEKRFISEKNIQSIKLVKIKDLVLEVPDTIKIGKIRERFVTNNSNSLLALYDQITKKFYLVNEKGKLISAIAGLGKGPKEVMQVFGFNFDEKNNLVVYDNQQLRMKIYTSDGEILKNVKLEDERKGHYIASPQLFAYNGKVYFGILESDYTTTFKDAPIWKSNLFAIYDFEGNLISKSGKYDPFYKKNKDYRYSPIIYLNPDNATLYSTHEYNYRIQSWALNNNITRVKYFGSRPENFKEVGQEDITGPLSKDKREELYTKQSYISGIFANNNHTFIVFQNIPQVYFERKNAQDKHYYLAVYDNDTSNYLGEIKLPYPLATISNNNLYLVEEDNPEAFKIGIYEIEY